MSKIFTATIPYSRLKTLERLNGGSLSGLDVGGYSILSVTRQPKAMPGESVLKVQGDGNRAGFLVALLEWQQGLEYAIAT